MKRLLESGASTFESPSIDLDEDVETTAVTAVGEWSAADVWIRGTDTDWGSVEVRLYARAGDMRVLLQSKLVQDGNYTLDGGVISAFVLAHRGPRVSALEVALFSAGAVGGTGVVYVRTWSNDAEHPLVVRASLVETGSLLAPLASPFYTRQLLGNRPTYAASTNGVISSGTTSATVTSIAYLWHPSSASVDCQIQKIMVSVGGAESNSVVLRGAFLTAINGTPGGTNATPQLFHTSDAASAATFTYGATGAPTRESSDTITWVGDGRGDGPYVWDASMEGRPLVLRSGNNRGFEIRSVVTANRTAAMNIAVTMIWTEF